MRNQNSQNQSLLVSERRTFQNLIKIPFQAHKCTCTESLKNIEKKLQLFSLRLDEVCANTNICFAKLMEYNGKIVNEQKKIETIQYSLWQIKEINDSILEKANKSVVKNQKQLENVNQQIQSLVRMMRDVKNWKNGYNQWSSQLQKKTSQMLKSNLKQNDQTIRKVYQAVQEIGLLQRKMIQQSPINSNIQSNLNLKARKKSRAFSHHDRQSISIKKYANFDDSTFC